MKYRDLCGLKVSEVSLGTVALGMDYAGQKKVKNPEKIIEAAVDVGINLFDTAPSYGSEYLLSNVDAIIATKVKSPNTLKNSTKILKSIDIVQWHNPTIGELRKSLMLEYMKSLKDYIPIVGASVYTKREALIAIKTFDMIQVPYNLNNREIEEIFPIAKKNGVSVLVRSVFARGELTSLDALKFALKADISSALIGARTVEDVRSAT